MGFFTRHGCWLILFCAIAPRLALAISVPPTQQEINDLVNAVGLEADLHPYFGAQQFKNGSLGLAMGAEITLVRLPPAFVTQMQSLGTSGLPPSLPVARLHLAKNIGKIIVLNGSWLVFAGFNYWGIGGQITVIEQEEGLNMALRFEYGYTQQQGTLEGSCYSPALVLGKKMDYTEVYIAAGAQLVQGNLMQDITVGGVTQQIKFPGGAVNWFGLLGAGFTFGPTGISLTLEMSYSMSGANTLGAKFGFEM